MKNAKPKKEGKPKQSGKPVFPPEGKQVRRVTPLTLKEYLGTVRGPGRI